MTLDEYFDNSPPQPTSGEKGLPHEIMAERLAPSPPFERYFDKSDPLYQAWLAGKELTPNERLKAQSLFDREAELFLAECVKFAHRIQLMDDLEQARDALVDAIFFVQAANDRAEQLRPPLLEPPPNYGQRGGVT